jgi:hypothetical protein
MEGILADKTAAIQLGKALFWDMQAGSDDRQACASCHFNAGADSRAINQINPGQPGGDNNFQVGGAPNYRLNPGSPDAGFGGFHDGDYPFHKLADVDQGLTLISDMNDVTGSQGVFATTHDQIVVSSRPALVTTTDTNSENDAGITRAPNGQLGPLIRVPVPKLPPHPPQPGVPPPTSAGSVELTTSVADPVFSFPDPGDPGKRINTRKNRSVSLRCCESGEFCCQRGECNSER